ncbi:MAG: hypothetical protein WCD31_04365 [Gillisia sp.]
MDNTEELLKFHKDLLWWTYMIDFAETEIIFIHKLLNSAAFESKNPNLFEKLQIFKDQIQKETGELGNLKVEIQEHRKKMEGMIECDDLSCDTLYLKNHELMKKKFEIFFKNFSEYMSKILNYTGSILKTKSGN